MENHISAGHSLLNLLYSCGQLCGKLWKKPLLTSIFEEFKEFIPNIPTKPPYISTVIHNLPTIGVSEGLILGLGPNPGG